MPMSKEVDGSLFAAALNEITGIWGKEMDTMQRSTLANQIVREIERRGIVDRIVDAEREACARIASGMGDASDCEHLGGMDMETGEVPCSLETRGETCVCAERSELAGKIATKIRARSTSI